ncbi:MAG: hypothetical protein PHF00_08300 [Elusimicrobia bacterium]|nr:hypothetical protein [Elusimicrobiota bacterium]
MRLLLRLAPKLIAAVLAALLSSQSAVAAVQTVSPRGAAVPAGASAGAAAAFAGARLAPHDLSLPKIGLAAPAFAAFPAPVPAAAQAGIAPAVVPAAPAAAEAARAMAEQRLAPAAQAAREAVAGLERASSDEAREAVEAQFSILTGARRVPGAPEDFAAVADFHAAAGLRGAVLESYAGMPLRPAEPAAKAKSPRAVEGGGGRGQVFHDPERNKSFWRYLGGYVVYLFGIQMYIVGLPYLVSAFTKNSLRDNNDPRAAAAETVKTLIRENRSLARIAHWGAQAISYATIPLFTRNSNGSLHWLPRSFWIRSAILGGIVTLFFASGLLSVSGALYALIGLIAVQSFFQGLSVTLEGAGVARMLGDESVTPAERMKANAIFTFVESLMSIIGPAVAGQIAQIRNWLGKMEVGGALIYGIYAIATGVAGLIYATVKLFSRKAPNSGTAAESDQPVGKLSVKDVLRELWTSLRDGVKLVFKDRFLRMWTIMTLLISLFADPLKFNVLPELVEGLIHGSGAIGAVLKIPVVGWLVQGMISTPMGFFSMLVVFSSLGGLAASLLMEPLRKFLARFGFKSEESIMMPLYALAALEIPLFWLMISVSSPWLMLPLYGLQTFVNSFGLMAIIGLHQKKLGAYAQGGGVSKILAAESFLGILAAIVATYLYGFVLSGIPIATSLLIAAVATTIYGIVRAASPWLLFSKAERRRGAPASADPSA